MVAVAIDSEGQKAFWEILLSALFEVRPFSGQEPGHPAPEGEHAKQRGRGQVGGAGDEMGPSLGLSHTGVSFPGAERSACLVQSSSKKREEA